MLDALVLYVGSSTAKAILKCWLKDEQVLADVTSDVMGLLSNRLPNIVERRRTASLLDRIAEEVGQRLEPFYRVEFSNLPEYELNATAIAVGGTIDKAQIDLALIVEKNLQPLLLEDHIRSKDPDAPVRADLSTDARALYDLTLREACNYISEIARTLPDFTNIATIESLRRGDELLVLVRRILEHLPLRATSLADMASDTARFEDQYRKEAARVLDRLTLFGVGASEASERYALSVAYISLSASVTHSTTGRTRQEAVVDRKHHAPEADEPDEDVEDYVRVEEALAHQKRVVVRGQAGCGKSTLLQWLAVSSAKGSFENNLSELNDTVPFFVQLRRYVGSDLPAPSQFLEHVGSMLVGTMPSGWVDNVLTEGRGLVLVDGVDELPEVQREQVRDWLSSLCSIFPESRFIVTSRPPAIDNKWLSAEGFRGLRG